MRDQEEGDVPSSSDLQEQAEEELLTSQVSLVSAENTPLLDTVDRLVEKHRVGLSAEQEHMMESGAGVSDSLTSGQEVVSRGVAHGVRFHSVRLSPAQHQAQEEALHGQRLQRQVQGVAGEGHERQGPQVGQQAREVRPGQGSLGSAAVQCTEVYKMYSEYCTEIFGSLQSHVTGHSLPKVTLCQVLSSESLVTEHSPSKNTFCQVLSSEGWIQEVERGDSRLQLGEECCVPHRAQGEEHHQAGHRYVEGELLGGVGLPTQNLEQVIVKLLKNTKSRSPTLGMSGNLRSLFAEGSRVQYQMVQGRSVLFTYGTERMMFLAETAGNDILLLLPDELFSPGEGWQTMLEEDPNYAGWAFFPYVAIGELIQVAVMPFMITEEERLEDLRVVIPSSLMSPALGEWLMEFREEVSRDGGQVSADSYPLSFHMLLSGVTLPPMMIFLEEALRLGMDLLVIPVNNIQWRRHFNGRV